MMDVDVAQEIGRHFSTLLDPYDEVEWGLRDVEIPGSGFLQEGVEFPVFWSDQCCRIVASKYFRGQVGTPEREWSLRQLIDRVVTTVRHHGLSLGHFVHEDEADVFATELRWLLVRQRLAFNSPVWFNCGVPAAVHREDPDQVLDEDRPVAVAQAPSVGQASACFILSVRDTMESIARLAATESAIFRGGSGAGVNLSALREEGAPLTLGGTASGPLGFMRALDANAGSIKSGGTTRRAAKMVVLDADHPDILDFVRCKALEEKKAHALGEAGYDLSLNGEAWASVQFQNANNSVRVPGELFRAADEGRHVPLRSRAADGRVVREVPAAKLLREIAQAAWECGDPGIQYEDAIQAWHPNPLAGRITATNPCAEHVYLDETACNLASVNLLAFLGEDGRFDVEGFCQAVRVAVTAQEILVDPAVYPTARIGQTTRRYRPIGCGYTNLGALVMALGLAYDSPEARAWTSAVTGLMHGTALCRSAQMAARLGPYEGFASDRDAHLEVARMHRAAATKHIPEVGALARGEYVAVAQAAHQALAEAVALGEAHGYRNGQVTVIAPTGTTSFMLGCETTGCEPYYLLSVGKDLVGGGREELRASVPARALATLGYEDDVAGEILAYLAATGHVEGAPGLRPAHLRVFDCADAAPGGTRSIAPEGHVRMLGAIQPFVSGSVSKTCNLPNEATVEDIEAIYRLGWELGLKCLAVYRAGSKRVQPLGQRGGRPGEAPRAVRRRLPNDRESVTHRFEVGGQKGYLTVGKFEDGTPGEVFIKMNKQGSTVSGLMDSLAIAWSLALQYGVPLEALIRLYADMRFEPAGMTRNGRVPFARSLPDYLVRQLAAMFMPEADQRAAGVVTDAMRAEFTAREREDAAGAQVALATPNGHSPRKAALQLGPSGDLCPACGSAGLVTTGSCATCRECGQSVGSCG